MHLQETETLAIDGGNKIRNNPFPIGNRFSGDELIFLKQAIEQNTLFYFQGNITKRFNEKFCNITGSKHSVTCSSGTAAIHAALGALEIGVGDEVITTSVTDMGTVIGILYQNAVPIFCDNDIFSYGMDIADLRRKISSRTKAIIVVHFAGSPCDMDAILAITASYNIPVIEDCAQAWGCTYKGRHVGTFGKIGCFSTNEFKHLSTGDGGVVCTDDKEIHYKLHLCLDKHYNRFASISSRDPVALSPNYRWTELQAAVGLAQLDKLPAILERRRYLCELFSKSIQKYPGILPRAHVCDSDCSYWFYIFRIDESIILQKRDYFVECLRAEGISCAAAYLPHPIYKYPVFQNENFFANGWPVKMLGLTNVDYKKVRCENAEHLLKTAVVVYINQFYTENDISHIAVAIQKVSYKLSTSEPIQDQGE